MTQKEMTLLKVLLSRPMSTLDTDITTGDPVQSKYASRQSYLTPFEVNKLLSNFNN